MGYYGWDEPERDEADEVKVEVEKPDYFQQALDDLDDRTAMDALDGLPLAKLVRDGYSHETIGRLVSMAVRAGCELMVVACGIDPEATRADMLRVQAEGEDLMREALLPASIERGIQEDDARDLLASAAGRAQSRRFSGEPITRLGAL